MQCMRKDAEELGGKENCWITDKGDGDNWDERQMGWRGKEGGARCRNDTKI